jgi:hypothetical protein
LTFAVPTRRENACASTNPIPPFTTSMHHTTLRTTTGHRIFPIVSRHHNSPRPVNQSLPVRRQPSRPKHAKRRLRKTWTRLLCADGTTRSLGRSSLSVLLPNITNNESARPCNRVFATIEHLHNHVKDHTCTLVPSKTPNRTFVCRWDGCEKDAPFGTKNHLDRHMQNHTRVENKSCNAHVQI